MAGWLLSCWHAVDAFHPGGAHLLKPCFSRYRVNFVSVSDGLDNKAIDESHVQATTKLLIHWKGEDVEGYSMQFRHVEFLGALSAVLESASRNGPHTNAVSFRDALSYNDTNTEMSESKIVRFNNAMQFIEVESALGEPEGMIPEQAFVRAAERCSLVHALYRVVAEEDSYSELSEAATKNGGFNDVMVGGSNAQSTWCVRVRHYGADAKNTKRYGARSRSMKLEREALNALKPMLRKFGGKVNLQNPDCKIYVFDGLEGSKKVLARRLATGPQVSVMDPNTRLCVTNTPLEPIAAFALCNVARVREGCTILDPYAGSCATLLAAAMIAPNCQSVGIEIAHNGLVNRLDVVRDFETRGLKPPAALIHGDSTEAAVREKARQAIGNLPFDMIVTDPPYGIRESKSYNYNAPLVELFSSLADDRQAGRPSLKVGGRLIAFVPCQEQENLRDCLPTDDQTREAGLKLEIVREQPLNDKLSRWLVAYSCVR